jgi:hypothetical protein
MLYQDKKGRILSEEEINDLEEWEIEESEIHVFEEM